MTAPGAGCDCIAMVTVEFGCDLSVDGWGNYGCPILVMIEFDDDDDWV